MRTVRLSRRWLVTLRARWLAPLLVAACGDGDSPCDDVASMCVELRVVSSTVLSIDHLELDVSYGDLHGTTTSEAPGGRAAPLPLVTAIVVDGAAAPLDVSVVAAGKLGGVVQGTGAAWTTVDGSGAASLEIRLAPASDCTPGGHYCGGDKLAGRSDIVYECNGGGVPIARGRCTHGCLVRPTQDDACDGGDEPCVEGGAYCGGDKLVGDPRSLYRCQSGVGVLIRECAVGCVQMPGSDDTCR